MAKRILTDETILAISLVTNPANNEQFFLFKSKDKAPDGTYQYNKTIPIVKSIESDDKLVVYGIVEVPDTYDAGGDLISEEEIIKSAHKVNASGLLIDHNHNFEKVEDTRIVETAVALTDFDIDDYEVKKGTWYIAVETRNKEMIELIKSGKVTGFSRFGFAKAELVKGSFNDYSKTDAQIKKDELVKSISDLDNDTKKDILSIIFKDFETAKENDDNNNIWKPMDYLISAIYDAYWDYYDDKDKFKEEVKISVEQFLKYIDNMTFIYKSIKEAEMTEEQVKAIVEKAIKEHLKDFNSKEIIEKSNKVNTDVTELKEQVKQLDEIKKSLGEVEEVLGKISDIIIKSDTVESNEDDESKQTKTALSKALAR